MLAHPLDGAGILVAVLAGLGAGIVNGIAGGGSLVSFPLLLALGYPALTANVTSTVGIWPGYLGGSAGFRGEIRVLKTRLFELAPTVICGGAVGGVLLLTTPSADFRRLAPWLVLFASLLFAVQPLLARALRLNHDKMSRSHRVSMHVATFVAAIYGAYFGAGLGVVLLAVLGLSLSEPLVRINGLRAVLALVINSVAVIIFVIDAPVAWKPAGAMVVSSLVGGYVGARVSRKVPNWLLRTVVISAGLATAASLLAN
jgi:hypothetical protein